MHALLLHYFPQVYRALARLCRIKYNISQSSVHVYIAPSGTMGNNGAVTLGTALPRAFTEGLYLHFEANAIYAGSAAGKYWAIMSTTTAGVVYNNTFSATSNGMPSLVTSPTAFVTTGPGAYTGATSEVAFGQATLPGGSLGPNGNWNSFLQFGTNSSANLKTGRVYFDGTLISAAGVTTSAFVTPQVVFSNKGSESINSALGFMNTRSSTTYIKTHTAIDTSADKVVKFAGILANATDYIGVEFMNIDVTYGA